MLDNERQALREMERYLGKTDPAFVARMTAPKGVPFPTFTVLLITLVVAAPLISLLFGMATVAIITATVLSVVTAVVRHRG
jgi:hypothetical protein